MNNISILDKNKCTGCRMCEQICPVKAIKVIENKEGFLEPSILEEKCINCGLCLKRCPQINNVNFNRLKNVKSYAAKNKNSNEQKQSSSGGLFSNFANYVLDNNGVIYGCAFNKNIKAEHIRIDNKKELYKLRGSKYVQSDTKDTFNKVKEDLRKDKLVLYTATPCQIAGLKQFLGKEYEKLITIDLVCHGVPSPKLFSKYISFLEERYHSKVIDYQFRNKEKNSWGYKIKIEFENGKIKYRDAKLDPYYKSFTMESIYRESCYNCKYSNDNRIGDITICDYWGIMKEHPEFYDENGVSAVIVNTNKGKELWNNVRNNIMYTDTCLESIKKWNHNLNSPTHRNIQRDNIYEDIDNKKFKKYIKENLKFKYELKDLIKYIIPIKIKKILKRKLERN